jgi:putative ABC transport system ATP-binding protein
MRVKLEDVWKIYKAGKVEVPALRGVTLDVKKGEFVVILGPSGSGKTTLLNLIGCLDRPSKGEIFFDGKKISEISEDELTLHRRKYIGFIFQFFNLIPTLTAKENVLLASELVENPRDADEVLEVVGLKYRANHFPSELSGGEQQRVAIARALVKNPPLILADEPTGSLDFETGKMILRVMRDINRDEGVTFLLVTHNSVIADMADRVIHLKDGRISRIIVNEEPAEPEELSW